MCDWVFVFTGLGCGPGFADILQDRISLFIFSILFFLGTAQLWREGPIKSCYFFLRYKSTFLFTKTFLLKVLATFWTQKQTNLWISASLNVEIQHLSLLQLSSRILHNATVRHQVNTSSRREPEHTDELIRFLQNCYFADTVKHK